MVNVISIEPLEDGWAVRHPGAANAQLFLSGAKAEDAAMRLGSRLALSGHPTEVVVYLRNGAVAGRRVCQPDGVSA